MVHNHANGTSHEDVPTASSSFSRSQTVSSGSITYTGRVDEGLVSGCGVITTVLCELAGMSIELKLSRILQIDLSSSSGRLRALSARHG